MRSRFWTSFAIAWLLPRLSRFHAAHPQIRVRLAIGNRSEIIRGLERNEYDIVLMGRPPPHVEVESVAMADHPHVLIAAAGHRLAGAASVTAEDLAHERFLAREQGSGTRMLMENFLERIGGRAIETPDSAVFPIHVLDLPAGKLGVLRIPSFYEWGYYQFCPQAVAEVGLPEDGECNEECGAAIGQKAAELLTMAVARQIERLKAEGVAALAVDITQNGGGSLWLDPVARMLTPVKLKAPRLAFTRTEGWRQTFADNLGLIDGDLANPSLSTEDRATLEAARAATQTAMDEAAKGCDRSGLWVGQATHCSLLGPAMFYATGTLDYAPPGAFASLAAAPALFFSALYLYQEGLWQGPLYVLMDEGSASAAEHFASILKDNGAATLIGEPTYGAGCGWMSSGEQTVTLSGTGAELYMPDCVWVRADGENEVAGVEPDILVPWRFYDAPLQKVRRLEGVLKALDFAAPPPGARPAARSGP